MIIKKTKKELNEVHLLRAIAALSVTFFHLAIGNQALFPTKSLLTNVISFGYLGVQMFFILSGYVICYSLPPNYNHKNFKAFLLKRLIRIYPPYLISILLVIVLTSASHSLTGLKNDFNFLDIFSNVFLLNNFGIGHYLNVVFWTLGIEIQFYVLLGISFYLLKTKKSIVIFVLVMLFFASIPRFKSLDLILPYVLMFTLGIITYFYKITKKLNLNLYSILVCTLLIHIYYYLGTPVLLTSFFSVVTILFWNQANRLILFFSNVSFSLYLTHVIVGGKVINLGLRYVDSLSERYILLIGAFGVSVLAAYIFYFLFEKPSMLLSKKILYKGNAIP